MIPLILNFCVVQHQQNMFQLEMFELTKLRKIDSVQKQYPSVGRRLNCEGVTPFKPIEPSILVRPESPIFKCIVYFRTDEHR